MQIHAMDQSIESVDSSHVESTLENEGYDFTIPKETPSGYDPILPPSIIVDHTSNDNIDDITVETIENQKIVSDIVISDNEDTQPPTSASEESLRYVELITSTDVFSALSESDADFLCEYTECSAEDFVILEESGINFPLCITYASLAHDFACPVTTIISMAPSEDEYISLFTNIEQYLNTVKSDVIGTAADAEFRSYLLEGYSCNEVFDAYSVSSTFDVDMKSVLKEGAHEAVLSLSENISMKEELEENRFAITNSGEKTAAALSSSSDEKVDIKNPFLGAPFIYSQNDHEKIALNSGAFVYEQVDYELPGKNGLNLLIKRRYHSAEASDATPAQQTTIILVYGYSVTYGYKAYMTMPGYPTTPDSAADWSTTVTFTSYAEASAFVSEYSGKTETVSGYYSGGMQQLRVYYANSPVQIQVSTNVSTSMTKDYNSFENDTWGLGCGWSFAFPALEYTSGNYNYYYHTANGDIYEVDFDSHKLKDYTLNDISVDKNISEFTNGDVYSYYRVKYQNGLCEYFDSNRNFIGYTNRYGDTIKFKHSKENGYKKITITDTLDRTVVISYSHSNYTMNAHTVEVSLPENNTIIYKIESAVGGSQYSLALTTVTDINGDQTHYSYTLSSAAFNIYGKSLTGYDRYFLNLTTITYPTNLQTTIAYKKVTRNYGQSGCAEAFCVTSRADQYGGSTYNQTTYAYSENDYTGFPAHSNPTKLPDTFQYTTTVTEPSGTVSLYTFNHKHLNTSILEKNGTEKSQEISYIYNEDKLPIKKTVKSYSKTNQSTPLTQITASEYDTYGHVISEWSTMADGNTGNTEYKTTYTYDAAYGILLTKTYKINAQTTVKIQNKLDSEKKNIVCTEVYCNNNNTSKTEYTYDASGNILTEKRYYNNFTASYLTEYTYQNRAYLTEVKHTGVKNTNGNAAATPGYANGTIAEKYTYDTLGRMTSHTDANGNKTNYAYDALGNVTKVTNPDGTSVTYTRSYTENYVIVTDENGAKVKYTYTPLGLEYETVDVESGSVMTRKEYDSASRLSSVSEYLYGGVTAYTYDSHGRVVSEKQKQGNTVLAEIQYTYDDAADNGKYQKITKTVIGDNTAPSVITTEYKDKNGNIVKTGRVSGNTEIADSYTFDYVGNAVTYLNANDSAQGLAFSQKMEYNERGQATKIYNALNQYIQNTYNNLGQLTTATDYAGTPTTYTYDALGRLLAQTITIENGKTATTKYEYDAQGNIITEYKPTNAVGGAASWSKTTYAYDNRGRLTNVKQYDGTTAALETSYTYDGVGNILKSVSGGKTTTYTYDRFGNVLTEKDSLGKTETYTYGTLGKLLSKKDRNGVTTTYSYDALGRTTSVSAGTDVVNYTYTKTGKTASEQNGWQKTQYTYDSFGQMVKAVETELQSYAHTPGTGGGTGGTGGGDGGDEGDEGGEEPPPAGTVVITFDANGGRVSPSTATVTVGGTYSSLPTPTRTGYTFTGWYLGNQKISNGDTVKIKENSTFTAQWQPITYKVTYNANGGTLKAGKTAQTQNCTYDAEFTLAEEIYERSGYTFKGWSKTSYSWGSYGVMAAGSKQKNLSATANATVNLYAVWSKTTFASNALETEDNVSEIQIEELSPMAAESTAQNLLSYTKTYTYDLSGNRTGFTLAKDGTTVQSVTYTYDRLNRLLTVSENGKTKATYTYDTNGNRASLTYDNGVTTTYGYNLANWVTSLTNKKGSTSLSSFTYTYFASGSQKTETDNAGTVTTYAYDGLGRLKTESETGGLTVNYTYDAAGNRSKMTVSGTEAYTATYTYDNGNRLTKESRLQNNGNVTTTYTYDNNGNTISKNVNGVSTTYSYNNFNQQTSVTSDGKTAQYAYNTQGIRTVKAVDGAVTKFYLDGGNVVGEVKNSQTTNYIRGINLICTSESYYLYSGRGDVINLISTLGVVEKTYSYDAFGDEKNSSEDDDNPFRYCGEYYDTETGTYYLRARYYDPLTGRFCSADSDKGDINKPLSLNLYTYCLNNPILYCDPTGYGPILKMLLHEGERRLNDILNLFNKTTADVSGFLLMMNEDSSGVYHASVDCWQQFGGYNDLYDCVFKEATSALPAKYDFKYNGEDLILWAWKGDYISLGAGAELGIYRRMVIDGLATEHWLVDKELALPMTLSLKDCYGNIIVDNYAPDEKQWWITGFNPAYKNVLAEELTAVYTVDFSGNIEMFKAFYNKYSVDPAWTFNMKKHTATLTF